MNEKDKILCLDLGGTGLKSGIVENGVLVRKYIVPTEISDGVEGIQRTFERVLGYYAADEYDAVAVSSAGTIDSERGVVTYATGLLPGYTGFALRKFIEMRTGRPCVCLNDGYAAAICESAGYKGTVLVLTLGTGVGGAYVKDGEMVAFAPEGIGHLPLVVNGLPCTCGRYGCIEQYISGKAFRRAVNESNRDVLWQRYEQGDRAITTKVGEWLSWIRRACDRLYREKAYDVVIFGGGLAEASGYWLNGETFSAAPYRAVAAKHGNDAGMLGAYLFYKKCMRI